MEENKKVSFDDFKKELKKRRVKEWFDQHIVQPVLGIMEWIKENPLAAATIGTLVAGVLKKGLSTRKESIEERRRDRDLYDPRTGMHTIARRKLRPSERVEIDRRYKEGESYVEILHDMHLLE